MNELANDKFKMTVTMQALTVIAVIMLLQANFTSARKECNNDEDCGRNQFCYDISKICTDYINCIWYYRQEAQEPARTADQCGPCLPGYSAEETPKDAIGGGEEADHCNKDPTTRPVVPTKTENFAQIAIWGVVAVLVIVILCVLYCVRDKIRCKPCCIKNADPEQQQMKMQDLAKINVSASAPPPDSIQRNNNEYPEEDRLLSYNKAKVSEHPYHVPYDHNRTVTAQPFHPPGWARQDPTYNPMDNHQVVAPSALDTDEETMTSTWTPGESNAIPENPFAGINAEREQNRTNAALARHTCPSSSTSADGHGSRQSNGAAGNSANGSRANYNIQFHVNTFIDQSGNGS